MRRIDFEKIISQADPELVFRSIGIDVVIDGREKKILCPGHLKTLGRRDRRLGSCIVTPNGCYCWSCGRGYSTIRAVSDYLDITMNEAAYKVAEICGISDVFDDDSDITYKTGFQYRALTKDEMRLIGLNPNGKKSADMIKGIVYDYEKDNVSEDTILSRETYDDEEGGLYHLSVNPVPVSISTLMAENRLSTSKTEETKKENAESENDDCNVYQWLVHNKIKESYLKYRVLKEKLENPLDNKEFYSFLYSTNVNSIGLLSAVMDALFALKNLYSEFDGDVDDLDELSEIYFSLLRKDEKGEC